jgi:hypothetical protein
MKGYNVGITDGGDFTMYVIEMASVDMIHTPSVTE